MEYRKIGNSDIEISVIAFGAWAIGGWMWGGTDEKAAHDAMLKSLDLGITTFDTAPVYGFGLSEKLVGKALEGKRSEVQILTKFGLRWDTEEGVFYFESEDAKGEKVKIHKFAGKESVLKECEDSLKRLRTDHIDLLQIHWHDPSTPLSETFEAVEQLLQDGKIRAAGVCNYDRPLMQEANQTVHIVSNQVPYSMVLRDIEDEVVPYCVDQGKGILAYSPLQRGILTGKIKPGHQFEKGDHRPKTPYYKPGNLEKINAFLDKIKPMAADKGASLAQLVLRWTIDQPGVSCALAGARNTQQVVDNAKSADLKISKEEMSFINNELLKLRLEV